MEAGDTTTAVAPASEPADQDVEAASAGGDPSSAPRSRSRWADWRPPTAVGVLGLTGLLAVPVVIALGVLRNPRWFPLIDMAHMELFVRDVPTSDPPLVGPIGRMYAYGATGNHPGPLTFYLLWPVYQLFGADGWGLQVAMGVVALVAAGLAIWLAHRRGGWPLALAMTALLAVLLRGFGFTVMLEVWNPHLPLLWWLVYLLAMWSLLSDDLRVLPLAVLAGSICVQNHVSYMPLVIGLAVVVGAVLMARAYQARRTASPNGAGARTGEATEATGGDPTPERGSRSRRQVVFWVVGSAALLALLWLPPMIEQLTNSPGNLSIIYASFRDPQDVQMAFGDAVRVWLAHLDAPDMLHIEGLKPGFPWANTPFNPTGLIVLAVWAGAVVVAWRRRDQVLLNLHIVVGAAVALGLVSISRLLGPPWPYLFYWARATTALLVLATAWTFLVALQRAPASGRRGLALPPLPRARPTMAVLGVLVLVGVTMLAVDARDAHMDDADLSRAVGDVVPATVDRLHDDPDCGDDCQVLVEWTDPVGIGGGGVGLIAALEREGFDARGVPDVEPYVRSHRVARPADADVRLHLVVSDEAIAEWESRPGTELVAEAAPYWPAHEPLAVFLVARGRS